MLWRNGNNDISIMDG